MKAWDYRAVYYDGECFCVDCLPAEEDRLEPNLDVYPIFATEEADSYPVCTICGREHDYIGLTDDGRAAEATREAAAADGDLTAD